MTATDGYGMLTAIHEYAFLSVTEHIFYQSVQQLIIDTCTIIDCANLQQFCFIDMVFGDNIWKLHVTRNLHKACRYYAFQILNSSSLSKKVI